MNMFNQVPLSSNLNQKFDDLNAENFNLFGLRLFEGKKKNGEMSDEEKADILNRRRAQVAPIINAQNEQIIADIRKGKAVKVPRSGGYKKAKAPSNIIDILGSILTGESGGSQATDENWKPGTGVADVKTIGDVTLPTVYNKPNKNKKTVFYVIIGILVIIAIILLIKKSKK